MQEYTVIKKSSSIHHCIKIPDIKPFVDIKDPRKWQQELRDKWSERDWA